MLYRKYLRFLQIKLCLLTQPNSIVEYDMITFLFSVFNRNCTSCGWIRRRGSPFCTIRTASSSSPDRVARGTHQPQIWRSWVEMRTTLALGGIMILFSIFLNLLAPRLARETFPGVEALAEVVRMPEVSLQAGELHEVALVPGERIEPESFWHRMFR